MSASNHRIKECDTVHHLISRIAHRVYFLEKEERCDFLEYVRRATVFSGVKLIGWCVMTNHFHLLVYLPFPEELDEKEIVRRYACLNGEKRGQELEDQLAAMHRMGETGENAAAETIAKIRRRMYDVGEYMKIVKQWFSQEYNHRRAHKGTMWESVYKDVAVPKRTDDMRQVLAYIHLNPVRAAITDAFDEYPWSSFTSFRRRDEMATEGMRFVYGDGITEDEIYDLHLQAMNKALGTLRLRRAIEIVRKREAGFEVPCDALTTEAMVAQAKAHLELVQTSLAAMKEERETARAKVVKCALIAQQVLETLERCGPMSTVDLAEKLEVPPRSLSRCVSKLQKSGKIMRDSRQAPWRIA